MAQPDQPATHSDVLATEVGVKEVDDDRETFSLTKYLTSSGPLSVVKPRLVDFIQHLLTSTAARTMTDNEKQASWAE